MIISRGRRYIFVHIPKTGGTAMSLALENRAMADDILIGDTPKAKRRRKRLKGAETAGRLWKHSRLADVEGLVSREEMEDFLVFTLVRNPWDRMVSYYHWLRDQNFEHDAIKVAQSHDFSGFINHPSTVSAIRANPYAHYVTLPDGRDGCDLYIRLEHLAGDMAALVDHLGFRPEVADGINRSERDADWRGYYSGKDAALVADLCAADIRRFGYGFDDPMSSGPAG